MTSGRRLLVLLLFAILVAANELLGHYVSRLFHDVMRVFLILAISVDVLYLVLKGSASVGDTSAKRKQILHDIAQMIARAKK